MALRYPLVLNGTTIEELQSADSLDVTSASISGDLTFTGTGARVKANFSDPIANNRLLFQTSTANSTTAVGIAPSGTGSTAIIYGANNSDLTNASYFDLRVSGSGNDVRLTSDYFGAGSYLPITFYTGGLEQVRITANSGGPANFQFSQSGTRVIGDFSNPIASNRVLFQTSTANSTTAVGIMPSGTGSTSIIYGTNSSNLTNASYFDLRVSGSGNDVRLTSDYYGAGTYLPITFYTGGSERVRIDTSGNVGIGTISPTATLNVVAATSSDALRITQTGTGNALVVEDSANPDSTPFVIDTVGNVVLGSSAQRFSANLLEINNAGNSNSGLGVIQWFTTNASGPAINIMKSQSGTPGTNGIVSNGAFSNIFFRFDDGANFLQAATITAAVDGTPGTNDMPGRLVFSTTADGAASPTERMRIDNAGRVGIGGGASAGDNIRLQTPATGATTTNSIFAFQEIRSDVTAAANIFRSSAYTQTTTFNLPALRHFFASPSAFGVGSTVTNQFGFFAENTLTGATNNYGFYSNIASGSGRYNFYAAGTADNYFGGPVVVSTSSSSDALRITQTGAGNALVVEDSANPDSSPFVVNTDGRVRRGTLSNTFSFQTAVGNTYNTPGIVNTGGSANDGALINAVFNPTGTAFGSALCLARSGGATVGDYTVIPNNLAIGQISFNGSDGVKFIEAAVIYGQVDGTPSVDDMPGRLVFSTTADGASSPTERMRINNAGNVGIGNGITSTDSVITVNKSMTGATTTFGIRNLSTVQSDSTSAAVSIQSGISTAATTFTLSGLRHFNATQGTFGAGSTVTTQIGFLADASLTGATNNVGFQSSIPAGTGRFNFYAAGTAENYFTGKIGVNVSGSASGIANALAITGLANAQGYRLESTINSDVTNQARGYVTFLSTQATAFTLSNLYHYQANQSTIGAGSAVGSQAGFIAEATLTGATNNYGFYSAIASGSGRYNFYAAGTADNVFVGLILSGASIKSNSATAGVGYGTGAGGTVTQTISRTTGVTLNKICGSVTLFSASATVAANFTVTNSTVSATDTILCSVQASGATEIYQATSYAVANGSFKIYMASPGTATEAPTINFTVIKSVTA